MSLGPHYAGSLVEFEEQDLIQDTSKPVSSLLNLKKWFGSIHDFFTVYLTDCNQGMLPRGRRRTGLPGARVRLRRGGRRVPGRDRGHPEGALPAAAAAQEVQQERVPGKKKCGDLSWIVCSFRAFFTFAVEESREPPQVRQGQERMKKTCMRLKRGVIDCYESDITINRWLVEYRVETELTYPPSCFISSVSIALLF